MRASGGLFGRVLGRRREHALHSKTRRRAAGGIAMLALAGGLIVLAVAPAFAEGSIRYVSTTGSNVLGIAPDEVVNDCRVEATPCLTIQHAVTQAAVSDIVSVAAGTYAETVTVAKQITLQGDPGGGTIIAPTSGDGIDVTGSGASASARLTIRDLTVQGGASGIYVAGGVAPGGTISYLTFDNITATESTGASGAGISFNNTAAITDVIIEDSTFSLNANAGVRIATAVPVFDGFVLRNSTFTSNKTGFSYNPSGTIWITQNVLYKSATGFAFEGLTFMTNGRGGATNDHDISIAGWTPISSISMSDITVILKNTDDVAGTWSTHGHGIVFQGLATNTVANWRPAGSIVLDNVQVSGGIPKSALYFLRFSDLSALSLTDVDVSGVTSGWFGQVNIDVAGPTVDLGTTTLRKMKVGYTASVDATDAVFEKANGDALDGTVLADNFTIEDQVQHAVDVSGGGFVRWNEGEVYVTPDSFISPLTTAPSIQRGIDVASAGDTVHVKAGTYLASLTVNKAVTLAGAKAGVPAGPAADPGSSRVFADATQETRIESTLTISASDVVLDGLVIDVATGHSIYAYGAEIEVRNSALIGRGSAKASSGGLAGLITQSSSSAESYLVEDNWFQGGQYGINFDGDSNTAGLTARGNYFTDVERGIQTNYSASGLVAASGNRFEDVTVGIRLARDEALITGNTFEDLNGTSTSQAAIRVASLSFSGCVSGASGITIAGNDISGADYGVLLDDPSATPTAPYRIVGNSFTVVEAEVAIRARALYCPSAGSPAMPASVSIDATGNWWGQDSGPAEGQISDGGATVDVSPYISEYTSDPERTGDPGFWPNPVTLTAICADEDGCQEVAVVVNQDLGSPSIELDLTAGQTASVSASGVIDPEVTPSPGDVAFATAIANFIDIAVLFGGSGDAPPYFTVCVDGSAPTQLWHYEEVSPSVFEWVNITGRALPSGTLAPITGKLCGMVSSFSPFAIASTSIPTTTTIARTTGATPSTYGSALVFTATVTPSAGMAPATGTVEFRAADDTALGTCTLSGGTCTWSGVALGVTGSPHTVTAYYLGDETSGDDMDESNSTGLAQAISAATLTVTPAAKSVTYGSSAPSGDFYTFSVTGFKNGETASGLTKAAGYTAPSCTSDYVDGDAVGTPRTISCSGGSADNYTFSPVTATLSVTRATLTVTPDPQTITFAAAPPTYSLEVTGFQNGETRSGLTIADGYTDPTCGSSYTQGDPAGAYTITCSLGAADNYTFSYGTATLTVSPLALVDTETWYTGQRLAYTKGSSSTTTQVTLTASITPNLPGDESNGCFGASVTEGKVTFRDAMTQAILAKDVAIAEVDGNCEEGIATAFATLSTGTYYAQAYLIQVDVSGSLEGSNDDQPESDTLVGEEVEEGKTLLVSMPPTAFPAGLFGNVNLPWADLVSSTSLGSESSVLSDVDPEGVVNVSFGFTYGKRVLPKGSATVIIPTTVEGESYVIRTNSITSVSTTISGSPKTGVVYAKANICRLTSIGCVAMEGNLSFRLDLTDYSDATADKIGVTVQSSKSSVLYYSNDWRKSGKAWATVQAAVAGDPEKFYVLIA